MKRRIFLLVVCFLFLAGAAEARTYKIGMIHWIAYSPLNVADVKGLWKDQGLDVEVINFGSNQELNAALEHERIDIACDMMGSWVGMYMSGVPLKIVCETDWSHGGDKIIAKKGLNAEDLKGRTIGVYLDQPSVTFFLNQYLKEINASFNDIDVVELEPEALADNFIAGRFEVIVNYDPQALRAEREGDGRIVATSASFEGVIPEGLVARADVLQTISEKDLSQIILGWMKAVEWSKDAANWDEYRTILNEQTFAGEDAYSEEDLKAMLGAVKIHGRSEQFQRNKTGIQVYLRELHDFLADNGMLTRDFTPGDLLKNDIAVKTLAP